MKYKIVVDKYVNVPEELADNPSIEKISSGSNYQYPVDYMNAFYVDADMIIVLASSTKVDDSYSAAVAGRRMCLDAMKRQGAVKKKIFILDYDPEAVNKSDIVRLAYNSCNKGLSFGDTCLDLMFEYNKVKMKHNFQQFSAMCPAGV